MQHIHTRTLVFLTLFLGVGIGVVGFRALPLNADTFDALTRMPVIENQSAANALSIIQEGDVGKSRSRSGALFINNTKNDNTGLTVYSNAGASVAQPLVRLEVDNPAWQEEILYIHSDAPTSRGLIRLDSPAPEIEFVETDQEGAAGKFEVRVQHDTFQINSRRGDDTTFENKISVTHDGDIVLEEGTLEVRGREPASFAGGLNVTGGCIAIDGECVISSSGDAVEHETDRHPEAPALMNGATLSDGEPEARLCNSYTERGAIVLDHKEHRLYVCNGPERGWDSLSLTD